MEKYIFWQRDSVSAIEMKFPQKKCLSVINVDATVLTTNFLYVFCFYRFFFSLEIKRSPEKEFVWESETVTATGSRQSTSLSTIQTRYGNSVSTPEATRTCKNEQSSLRKEARAVFQFRPHIVDTEMIAEAVFVDAVSETSSWHIVPQVSRGALEKEHKTCE